MTSVSVVRTAAVAALAVGGAALAAVGALHWAIDQGDVRAAVATAFGKAVAADLAIGPTRIELWPRPAVVIDDVTVGSGPIGLTAPRVTAKLRLLPLVVGRVEFDKIVLDQPTLAMGVGTPLAPMPAAADPVARPDLRLVGGTISLRRADGRVDRLDDVAATAAWSGAQLNLSGRFRLRGQAVEAHALVGNVDALLKGTRSTARLRLIAPVLRTTFEGHALLSRGVQLEGALSAESNSLRAALAWFDTDAPLRGGLGKFALRGQAQVSPHQIALAQAAVELDGNKAEGSLAVRFDGDRPALHATLAGDVLTLTPYVSGLSFGSPSGGWSRAPLDVSGLAAADADLRLSTSRLVIGSATIGRAAGTVVARNGRLTVTLGEAQVFAGTLRGAVTVAPGEPGAALRLDVVAQDVDLDRATSDLFGVKRLEGRGALSLSLEGQGATMAELASSATGSLRASAAGGALAGINVEQVLRRVERRPLSGLGDPRGGRTAFDRLALQVRIVEGTATCEEARLESPVVRVGLAGSASLADQAFELRGTAALVRTAGGFELPFVVRGPWGDPALLPDTESLIRRSGAAAPLLEALRERALRDAARPAEPAPGAPAGAAP